MPGSMRIRIMNEVFMQVKTLFGSLTTPLNRSGQSALTYYSEVDLSHQQKIIFQNGLTSLGSCFHSRELAVPEEERD